MFHFQDPEAFLSSSMYATQFSDVPLEAFLTPAIFSGHPFHNLDEQSI